MTENAGTTPATPTRAKAKVDPRTRGVWVTHYYDPGEKTGDDSAEVTPHSSEISALRDAVKSAKTATFVEFGQSLADAIKAGK